MSDLFADAPNWLADLIARHQSKVDYLAIRLEEAEGTAILLRGDRIETLSEGIAIGGHVRACHRGGWGFASFDSLDCLQDHVQQAIAAAQRVGDDITRLAPVKPIQDQQMVSLMGTDPRMISLARKKELCNHYAELLRSVSDRITTTSVRYSDSNQHTILATTDGTLIEQSWVDMEMRFAATARQGAMVQTGRETIGSRNGYEDLEHLNHQVIAAAQRAVDALTLPSVRGGTYTVVIDPILTGLFVHEAFGHLSEADMPMKILIS